MCSSQQIRAEMGFTKQAGGWESKSIHMGDEIYADVEISNVFNFVTADGSKNERVMKAINDEGITAKKEPRNETGLNDVGLGWKNALKIVNKINEMGLTNEQMQNFLNDDMKLKSKSDAQYAPFTDIYNGKVGITCLILRGEAQYNELAKKGWTVVTKDYTIQDGNQGTNNELAVRYYLLPMTTVNLAKSQEAFVEGTPNHSETNIFRFDNHSDFMRKGGIANQMAFWAEAIKKDGDEIKNFATGDVRERKQPEGFDAVEKGFAIDSENASLHVAVGRKLIEWNSFMNSNFYGLVKLHLPQPEFALNSGGIIPNEDFMTRADQRLVWTISLFDGVKPPESIKLGVRSAKSAAALNGGLFDGEEVEMTQVGNIIAMPWNPNDDMALQVEDCERTTFTRGGQPKQWDPELLKKYKQAEYRDAHWQIEGDQTLLD